MDNPNFGDLLYITTTPHCSAPITYLGTDDSGEITLYAEGHITINLTTTEGFTEQLVRDE